MGIEYIGAFQVVLGVIARFWPVWLGLAIMLTLSFTFKKRLGLYGQLFDSGVGIAGVYSAAVAETKVAQVHEMAKEEGFPLRCSMEPE